MNTIGERIRAKRQELSMSQQELADKAGLKSKVDIYYLETGKREYRPDKMKKIAEALGVTVDYLTGTEKTADYYGRETAEIAQAIYEDHNLRQLFDAARNCSPHQLELAHNMLKVIIEHET